MTISYFDFRVFSSGKVEDIYFKNCSLGIHIPVVYKLIKPGLGKKARRYSDVIYSERQEGRLIYEEHGFISSRDVLIAIVKSFEYFLIHFRKFSDYSYLKEWVSGDIYENILSERISANILSRLRPKTVVYPWENLVWERLLCLESAKQEIETIGFQHTGFSRKLAQHFVTDQFPLYPQGFPDLVVCNGMIHCEVLRSTQLPSNLVHTRAIRQEDYLNYNTTRVVQSHNKRILVTLSFDTGTYVQIFEYFRKEELFGYEIVFKIHPIHKSKYEGLNLTIWEETMNIDMFDFVISHDNSWIFEAILCGLPSVVLTLEELDIRDFQSPLYRHRIPDSSFKNMIENLPQIVDSSNKLISSGYLERYFSNEDISDAMDKFKFNVILSSGV